MMKRELEKKIRSVCDEIGTAAAAERLDELTEQMNKAYDRRIALGMSELDAYRDLLGDIDSIREMLRSLPLTEGDISAFEFEEKKKAGSKLLGKIESQMWLVTVLIYFLGSFTFLSWKTSWLIFLWGSVGSTIIGMVKKLNNGKDYKKTMKGGLSSIMWLTVTILYFFVSLTFGGWKLTWLLFILATVLQSVINSVYSEK